MRRLGWCAVSAVAGLLLVAGASAAREDGMFVFKRWAAESMGYRGAIYVANADGTRVRRLTSPSGHAWDAVWSPDGSKIAYTSSANPRGIVMNADGSGKRQLCRDVLCVGAGRSPAWSPDGRQIAFIWGGNWVGIVNADGTDLRFVGVRRNLNVVGLDWSPDGKRLALGTSYPTTTGPWGYSARIWVVDLDGSGLKLLAGNAANDPRWSPDGATILFTKDDGTGIYVVNAAGGTPRLIRKTPRNARVEFATWSSQGTEIAFFQFFRGYQLHVFRLSDRRDRIVTLRPPVCGAGYSCSVLDWQPRRGPAKLTVTP